MSIRRIAVIGAGTMGNGIAQVCALARLHITIVDVSTAALERGLSTIRSSLERLVQKEKLQSGERDEAVRRIHSTTSYQELQGADLVIEAATENLALKLRILREIEAVVGDSAVIAAHLSAGIAALQRCVGFVVEKYGCDVRTAAARAVPLLELFGTVAGGWQLARAALVARERIAQGEGDAKFLQAKLLTARFYGPRHGPGSRPCGEGDPGCCRRARV